jgi:hypothetical protein
MRTIIDLELAKRAAKRLGRLPSFWETPHSERGVYDPLDEGLDASALLARQNSQAARLKTALPRLHDAMAVISSWQPSSGNPATKLPSLDEIKPVLQAKRAFFDQGMHRAYIIFFREMMDWPLSNINVAANVREPLAYTVSRTFGLNIPLLAPATLAKNPTGFEPSDLSQLEKSYPDGAIALLGEPLVDRTQEGHHWFSPGALVMDGQSTDITLRVGLESFDDLLDIRRDPDGYRVKRLDDIGQWCSQTFAKCRHPKWQLDNGFDDLGDDPL